MSAVTSDSIVIATAKAKPGREVDLERALRDVAAPTRAQPGCVQFSLPARRAVMYPEGSGSADARDAERRTRISAPPWRGHVRPRSPDCEARRR